MQRECAGSACQAVGGFSARRRRSPLCLVDQSSPADPLIVDDIGHFVDKIMQKELFYSNRRFDCCLAATGLQAELPGPALLFDVGQMFPNRPTSRVARPVHFRRV